MDDPPIAVAGEKIARDDAAHPREPARRVVGVGGGNPVKTGAAHEPPGGVIAVAGCLPLTRGHACQAVQGVVGVGCRASSFANITDSPRYLYFESCTGPAFSSP